MPTREELELLNLLAEQRRLNASSEGPETSSPLPDLTPDMLLSASARREIEAAQWLSGQRTVTLPGPMARPSHGAPRTAAEFQTSSEMGDLDLDSEYQAPQVTGHDGEVLSSLFMGREAQEAQAALGGGAYDGGYDIEFDADSMIEGRTMPNEAARFQVGRQSPPRMPFSARMAAGPSDGVVVSSRQNGGWRPDPGAARPRPNEGTIRERLREAGVPVYEPEPHAAPPPRPAPAPRSDVYRPTVYENILRGGFLDDD